MTQDQAFQTLLENKRRAVTAAKKAVEKAEKNLETLEAELRGMTELMDALQRPVGSPLPESGGQKRGLSDKWKAVIAEIATAYPADFSLSDIADICKRRGVDATADTIRGQMHTYRTQRRYLESPVPGRFQATVEGAIAAGVALGEPVQ